MLKDGLQTPLILDFTDAFSWTIDFNTDTRNGDEYTALWEENFAAGGEIISQDLLAASYKHVYDKKPTYAFFFEDDFYDETGKISKKMFLKSPISFRGYRISSRFNPSRLHPILKIRRPHLGIDYAAPVGTPVQAVADGSVKFAGWKGGFGNFVEIKHPNNFTTMYGHLKSFGKGVKAGAKVKQGQVVGYIGSTGLSTGPHLDFRIKEGSKFLDFLKMRNRNSAVRDVPAEKKEEFEAVKKLYLKELDSAQMADAAQPAATPAETGEQNNETNEDSPNGRTE
jgi:murein DD-endopeptidase MepM/ murein hydrolase activator NlpD